MGEAADALVEEIDERAEVFGVDLFGNARRVKIEPGAVLVGSARSGCGWAPDVAPILNHDSVPKASSPSLYIDYACGEMARSRAPVSGRALCKPDASRSRACRFYMEAHLALLR